MLIFLLITTNRIQNSHCADGSRDVVDPEYVRSPQLPGGKARDAASAPLERIGQIEHFADDRFPADG